ncbi:MULTISPECIES: LCP family protein [unclassified Streptomyces]|uniref:LCP family protein n=1 Tax=unclassified Streptomyces TaxID=2593676 RepID=UPI0011632B46|nr:MULTISPECIES: LCP family protein [unclassified Streptomyces]NMI61010.1 LCP family protein [Streptomyces sp. RLA2-12]QDN60124.1 LytR family transcriptional regulator [Streptomyces sp. S1D4-20]QDN70178.1 LytR family transcriptional regulator [Streptomyces sp. S1D4-14]QDO52631.1 LytR family transcriptional regulator [Streptomyces sp. RLB3-5]QDO62874.1 LytR family transcriptional regulator [Streptomyces sp. RLB1-8]
MSAESMPEPGTPGDPGTSAPRGRVKGSRRKPRSTRSKALLITAWTAAGIVVLGGAGAGYLYFKLNGNIKTVDINQALGTDRPLKVDNGSENILVLGSDTRSGSNKKLGGGTDDGSARSDTAMIVHIYEGHRKASVVSIPRDTLVPRPSCTDAKGVTHAAATGVMFNSAYSTGGAACAVKTVESMSGIRMDHYIEVDFSGFQKLIDDLDGVRVTTTKNIKDPDSHLNLTAGTHTLDGQQALGLVRTRHGVGDGSDLGRIQLQQAFIKALVNQVKHIGVLSSPTKLYDLADTATKTVTTDSDLGTVKNLASFANGLKGISSSNMNMVTMPVQYDSADANRVLVDKAKAQLVWTALKNDGAIPKAATKGTATGTAKGVVSS